MKRLILFCSALMFSIGLFANNIVPSGSLGLVNGSNASNTLSGPIRCGFAAKNASSRLQAGASYYGVMEMTGNVWEYVVGIYSTGASFDGSKHGDGNLTVGGAPAGAGFSNVTGWLNQTASVGGAGGAGSFKGGSFGDNFNSAGNGYTQVSARYYMNNGNGARSYSTGGRGVRRSYN